MTSVLSSRLARSMWRAERLVLRGPALLAGAEVVEPGLADRAHPVAGPAPAARSRPAPRRACPPRRAAAPRWGAAPRRRPARRASRRPRPPSGRRAGRSRSARSGARRPRRPRRAPRRSASQASSGRRRCRGGSGCRRPGAAAARAPAAAPGRGGGRVRSSVRGAGAGRAARSRRAPHARSRRSDRSTASASRSGSWVGIQWLTPSSTSRRYGAGDVRARGRSTLAVDRDVAVAPHQGRRHARPSPPVARAAAAQRKSARYQPSAAGSAPYVDDLAAEPGDLVGSMPRARAGQSSSGRRAGRPASGSHGSWKKRMYQDEQPLAGGHIARRKATGCGTETAVSVRTRSGRRGDQPGDRRTPVVADQVHRTADRVDQRRDVGGQLVDACSRGAARGRAPGE